MNVAAVVAASLRGLAVVVVAAAAVDVVISLVVPREIARDSKKSKKRSEHLY